jgi:hypothetical protein
VRNFSPNRSMPVRGTLKKYTLHSTTTAEHRQPDNQQERRLEESLAVNQFEKTENQVEQNKSHAVAGIEVHPTPSVGVRTLISGRAEKPCTIFPIF